MEPLDLRAYRLEAGDVRTVDLAIPFDPIVLGGERYTVEPNPVPARLVLQASSDGLYLKLALRAEVVGPCARCLEPARTPVRVEAAEYHARHPEPGAEDELTCEYLDDQDQLDLERWSRDALVLELPRQILCSENCPGLCPRCGARLADDPQHSCETDEVDERWAKLRELM
ncbi:MAG: YceD family protein [Gaiellales bacterium]|jgi:uncharacterized protein